MNLKRITAIGLSVTILALNSISFAEVDSHKITTTSTQTELDSIKPNDGEYLSMRGKIKEVRKSDNGVSILVQNEFKDGLQEVVLHIGESVNIYSTKTMDKINRDELKENAVVSVSFRVNTPMALSEPPQITPEVIILEDSKDTLFTIVEKFDDNLITADGNYILKPNDETKIVGIDGKGAKLNDVKGAEALVFTGVVTKSLPGQTTPHKIIILKDKPEYEFKLKANDLKVVDDVNMIPLRKVAEGLGFEVKWNPKSRSVEVIKGPNWNLVTIGKNQYNFAKMNLELEAAPVIINERTYVPQAYVKDILKAEIKSAEDGLYISK